jgi:aminoglycoside phosphotransferase (APT) family kinase protein
MVIGAPFYVMERRRGLVLRNGCPTELNIDREMAYRLSTTLIDTLASLHAVDFQAAGLGDLGKPTGYVERQVTGCIKRYTQASDRVLPEMERVGRWLAETLPPESGAAVIHNDFKYDNVMFDAADPSTIVAVLDWEMVTVGDPLMDLGTTLGFWVEAGDPEALRRSAFGPTALPGSMTRRELVDRYQEQSGREVANPLFYYAYGLYKIGMLLQQIFARYARGDTRDARFARLEQVVVDVAQQADRVVQSGSL